MGWVASSNGLFYDRDEDQVVYFDPCSGDTHLVGELVARLLGFLQRRERGEEDIKAFLSEQASVSLEYIESEGLVADVLDQLLALDLIEFR